MPSFDVVSELDFGEVTNAANQAIREIDNRFDFKGGKSKLEFEKEAKQIKLLAEDDMKLRSMKQIMEQKMASRGLDLRSLNFGQEEAVGGSMIRQVVTFQEGIGKDEAKKIVKMIKDQKLKVTAQVQDDKVRVTGKKIDDLQSVIAFLKKTALSMPLQFVNMRS